MSYEGVPNRTQATPFQTVTDADVVEIAQEDEECLQVILPGARGFISRDAAKDLAFQLIDAAQEVPAQHQKLTPEGHRKRMGLTQEEASEKIGISRVYLSQIECGEAANVSLRVCRRMAALYNCTIGAVGIELPQ